MIAVSGLQKSFYEGGREIRAVDDVSFAVGPGEAYGLLGPNGAGKTTTLRMILGLLRPDGGYAEVGGVRTSDAPDEVKRRIGFVSAGAGLYQWLTPRETLLFFADAYGMTPSAAAAAVERLARIFELDDFLDRRAATLSTGQRQRVILARALIHDPPIMLLDEPTRGLDIAGSKVIFDYVDHLRGQAKAVIVSTHRLDEAQRICDRFGLLHRGKMAYEGTLAELQSLTGLPTLADMFLNLLSPSRPASEKAPQEASV
jgi:ABC-2 type transport system ATP-binding protein/sodium transport system ATP-binding protein